MTESKFAYENLDVWNRAVDFSVMVIDAVENMSTHRKHYRMLEQIEPASSSVAMNLAEGKGWNRDCPFSFQLLASIFRLQPSSFQLGALSSYSTSPITYQ